jgi:nicotinate phosphoribosyltransferase
MPQLPISDEYFNRCARVVAYSDAYRQRVRYAVFARRDSILCGVNRSVAFIDQQCVGPITIKARRDGERYKANQAAMIVEGMFGELVNLETTYLGMLAFTGAATNMRAIVDAAGGIPVIDMAARHYPFEIIEQTAYAAAIGGAVGTSTQAGYHYVHKWLGIGHDDRIQVDDEPPREFKLYGSIPHALNAAYDGSSVEAAIAYHERLPDIPLTALIDFEGRELDACRQAYKRFGDQLFAVRIDTGGERVHQGGHAKPQPELVDRILASATDRKAAQAALDRYGFGPGVTIEEVFNVRRVLDEIGATNTQITVSSGFDARKTAAFRVCGAPMDGIGTGSWVDFAMFTSDITHVFENGRWLPRCKAGRGETITCPQDLPVRVHRQ